MSSSHIIETRTITKTKTLRYRQFERSCTVTETVVVERPAEPPVESRRVSWGRVKAPLAEVKFVAGLVFVVPAALVVAGLFLTGYAAEALQAVGIL